MARRGWAAIDLAREARLSPATISTALSGRPISARSLALIAAALMHAPVIDIIDSLVGDSDERTRLRLA
jgi:transcriptional regulator with XRE-family HTH domain